MKRDNLYPGTTDGRTTAPLATVDNLVVRFRAHNATIYAVNGIRFAVNSGETVGIVGESGCGKSVTSLAMIRLLPATGRVEGGKVIFDGKDILTLRDREMRRLRGNEIAMVFQDPMTSLNPVIRIETQIVEALTSHRRLRRGDARRRALGLLQKVAIPRPEQVLRNYPHELSGGMRQRVMIAIALALSPKLLIADEPTTALDVTIQAQILELLAELTRESDTAVILITHDLGVVAGMTQRVMVMYAGLIVESGPTADIFATPRHPYTVGLLHSIPTLDDEGDRELIPIEGAPPNQTEPISGCPFAPRCTWRRPICWQVNPLLQPVSDHPGIGRVLHETACHNPPTDEEGRVGRPLREGFVAAPPPESVVALTEPARVRAN